MLGLPLTFAAPIVLTALAALPAIWLILRVTPPRPRRIDFPPLKILVRPAAETRDAGAHAVVAAALRLAIAALLILAAAGPVWNPTQGQDGRAPLLLIVDNGFPAAHDWRERLALAVERVEAAGRESRVVAVVATADKPVELQALNPAAALERLRAVKPQPHLADRRAHLAAIERFLAAVPGRGRGLDQSTASPALTAKPSSRASPG